MKRELFVEMVADYLNGFLILANINFSPAHTEF